MVIRVKVFSESFVSSVLKKMTARMVTKTINEREFVLNYLLFSSY